MKVREFINIVNNLEAEVDVYDNYVGEIAICYVGDKTNKLTEDGEKRFGKMLDETDIAWKGGMSATLHINEYNDDDVDKMFELAREFFYGVAGYISIEKSERYFGVE